MEPRTVACLQGLYFVATGVWPLLHIKSFIAVTGPKTDVWLVKTVGALVASMGAALLAGAYEGPGAGIAVLGAGSAAAFMAVEVYYVRKKTISKIYALDAAAEAALVAAWAFSLS